MKKKLPFVEIPKKYIELVGEPDKGTRMYRAYGNDEDFANWYDIVVDICKGDGCVGIGFAAMYSRVSRPAVHKRLKEGRLTGFCFHKVEEGKLFKGRKKLSEGGFPYVFIPVSECKAWAETLKNRKDRKEALKDQKEGSWNDRFLRSNRRWRKRLKKEK